MSGNHCVVLVKLTNVLRCVDGCEDTEFLQPSLESRPACLETEQSVGPTAN